MRRTLLISLPALLALTQSARAQTPERYSIPGSTVAVYNLAGAVTIERGTGSNIVVEVTRGGSDAERLEVERIEVDGRAALVVRYPQGDVVYPEGRGSTQLTVRSDGTFGGGSFLDALRNRVSIRRSGRGTEAHADLRILVPAGHSLDLRLAVGDVVASDIEGGLDIDVHSASVRTRSTNGRLRIDTGSGSVDVNDAQGDDILIDTGSGSVEANAIRATGLTIDTGSGSVRGSGIRATDLRVDTGSGRITLTDVSASDIVLDTGSGAVELDLRTQMERLVIDTGSGGVRVTVPSDLSAAINIETGSGGVDVDLPIAVTRRGRNSLIGTLGTGGGSIVIDTGSGGVRIVGR